MAGLEVVVRPFVFPDIRPRARQSLPPQDDPEKGFAKINGQPAKQVTMTYTLSISSSHSRPVEVERRVDVARIYQQEDDGTVNRENFVDVSVANRIKTKGGQKGNPYDPRFPGELTGEITTYYYKRAEPTDNIEIIEDDQIIKNTGPGTE